MKIPGTFRFLLCMVVLAAGGSLLAPAGASAQTRTVTGNFTGDYQGSFVHTVTVTASGTTTQTLYTRHGDRATRTDTSTTSAADGNGGYTLDESRIDFGATAADTTHAVYTRVQPGRHTATGTFTTAGGDSGALSAVLSRTAGGVSRSELHVSTSTGNTLVLRVDHDGDGSAGCKLLVLNPDGSLTSSSLVCYAGSPTPTPTPVPTATPGPTATPTPTVAGG